MNFLYDVLGVPFGYVMRLIYSLVQNYGVAIILFTIFSKLLLFPINYKTQKSSAKMQRLNPKLKALRQKYQKDPQKLQEAQMALYQEEGVNPGASCLPMFLQFFLLFGILAVVYKPLTHVLGYSGDVIDNVVNMVIDQFPDIAQKFKGGDLREELYVMEAFRQDPGLFNVAGFDNGEVGAFLDNFKFLGIDLGVTPNIKDVSNFGLWCIPFVSGILQLVMTIYSQVVNKKRNPDQPNMGCMNIMLYGMPIFSIWFAFNVPAGVGFYWACSSLVSLLIQIGLNRYFTPERVEEICEKDNKKNKAKYANGKKSFTQRMMEAQNQVNAANTSLRDADTDSMSKKEKSQYESQRIKEARRRMAEKYGEEYSDDE
ncbi:MAG: YidC/Oxa1 family membrane protein insertase [Oscillospiraceae bacterium]|nr:YidC/Oxa1 family membrane protein insertase [Oscillospiraceae bacterium]